MRVHATAPSSRSRLADGSAGVATTAAPCWTAAPSETSMSSSGSVEIAGATATRDRVRRSPRSIGSDVGAGGGSDVIPSPAASSRSTLLARSGSRFCTLACDTRRLRVIRLYVSCAGDMRA
ncbi:MAG: hypothetical protein KIT31_22950 [Deltaproteobacteria bacterium]|nr:hypothetical protein [Deltaproteobacteria bacterium]